VLQQRACGLNLTLGTRAGAAMGGKKALFGGMSDDATAPKAAIW
jgi:hypothetical protein